MPRYFRSIPICRGPISLHSTLQRLDHSLAAGLTNPLWLCAARVGKVRAERPASLYSPFSSEQGQIQSNKMVSRKGRTGVMETRQLSCQRAFLSLEYSYFSLLRPQQCTPCTTVALPNPSTLSLCRGNKEFILVTTPQIQSVVKPDHTI